MKDFSLKTWFLLCVCFFVTWLATTYWHSAIELLKLILSAASPLIIGLVISYILNLLMSFYERTTFFQKNFNASSRRIICLCLAIISMVAIVAGVVRLVIPELVLCLQLLFAEVPSFIDALLKNENIRILLPETITNDLAGLNWQEILNKIAPVLTTGISTIGTFVSSIFSSLVTGLLSLIFAIYLLLGKESLQAQTDRVLKTYMKPAHYNRLLEILNIFNDCFHRYFVGQCAEAVILGILCALGMLVLQFPYAVMIGTLVGFTALIPVAGAYIGAAVGAIMILTVSPIQAVFFLIFIVILQQLEGNLIYPKVVGSSLGLPAIWVLAAVTVGGGVMGIAGMLLGVPTAAAFYRLLKEDVFQREQSHKPNHIEITE
ncbi:MAG: AI-2E family transporter [Erysipelotrichaceae bacterium]|nr:AI-2E family transporter [Erysipelotrichaceae bacterium]